MDTSTDDLVAFIRRHRNEILDRWEQAARHVPGSSELQVAVLRDEIEDVVEEIATSLERSGAPSSRRQALTTATAIGGHVLQRAEIGMTVAAVVEETLALRDAIEGAWPPAQTPEGRDALLALRSAVDRIVISTTGRFAQLRMRLLEAIGDIIRRYPGESLDRTLHDVLGTLSKCVEGIDTMVVLLKEDAGDELRARAAFGLDEEVIEGFTLRVGEGFAGTIAVERKPRLVRSASTDPLVTNPILRRSGVRALYGVPLVHGDALLGVAHMGSKSADDFSEAAKQLFRVVMQRTAGMVYQAILLENIDRERSRYQAVTENAPTIIFSKDLEGRYLGISRRAITDLGLSPEQIVGRTDFDVFPAEIAARLHEADREVLERRAMVQKDELWLRRGREPRTFLSSRFPILDPSGRVSAIAGVATDVTEQRRQQHGQAHLAEIGRLVATVQDEEELLRRIAEDIVPFAADCCVVELLEGERVRRAVVHHRDPKRADLARWYQNLPLDRTRPHLTEPVLTAREVVYVREVPPVYLESIAQDPEHLRVLREINPTSMIQMPLVARGHFFGAWVFLRCGPSPPYDELDLRFATELGSLVSLAIDNAHLYKGARRATRAREDLLGVVAHDLRSPLGAITMGSKLLGSELAPESPQARRHLEVVRRSAEQMNKLVSNLLDEHAMESGGVSIAAGPRPTDVLVRDAAEAHRGLVEGASLSLEVALAEGLPEVLADADRVEQVFDNLLTNAVKLTPKGGRVTLGAKLEEDDVWFFVGDTGPGVDKAMLPHLFDKFWQARHADRRGVGLGLAICKGIVEAHGGRIWATSGEGRGLTVSFTLPRAHAAKAPARAAND